MLKFELPWKQWQQDYKGNENDDANNENHNTDDNGEENNIDDNYHTWDFSVVALFLSHMGDTSSPASRSLSPWNEVILSNL